MKPFLAACWISVWDVVTKLCGLPGLDTSYAVVLSAGLAALAFDDVAIGQAIAATATSANTKLAVKALKRCLIVICFTYPPRLTDTTTILLYRTGECECGIMNV